MPEINLQPFIDRNNLYAASRTLFISDLSIPLKRITELPVDLHELFGDGYRDKLHSSIRHAYFIGTVDDDAFSLEGETPVEPPESSTEGSTGIPACDGESSTGFQPVENNHTNPNTATDGCATMETDTGKDACATFRDRTARTDYEGLIVFALDLKPRDNGRAPTRTQLAELTRSFNRAFNGHPVTVLFRYDADNTAYMSLATCERTAYQQRWREGEKPGKVSLLRDINLADPHAGHLRILNELQIPRSGRNAVTTFNGLYQHWQQVLNADILNKEFYRELSDWYFWARKQVQFPEGAGADENLRNATSTIRLITRVLFVWFLKEKNLIPESLFRRSDLEKILTWNDPNNSTYYKAILQNLFFATLNREMGKREFRKDGQHRGITNLYRYQCYFRAPATALQLFQNIPFLNGGLFECLDKPDPKQKGPQGGDVMIRVDSFSDRNDNPLCVPDELFFGDEREVDLSAEYGQRNRRSEKVRGLIPILNTYKFTITENTPLEQDVALDPELLGKVFENLLASYNPETQSTARKQTGSYYTPREIVDYMVCESVLSYLEGSTGIPACDKEEGSTGFQPVENKNTDNTGKDACATFKPFDFGDPLEITERNLPHWEQPGVTYFVTFRLGDSIPQDKLERWQQERDAWLANHSEPFSDDEIAEYNRLFSERIQQWLDAGHGKCYLKRPDVSKIVADSLQYFEGERYKLLSWVVMPNHVHALVKPLDNYSLSEILHSWKSYTATECNRFLGRSGTFWQDESYDHAVRSEKQLRTLINYIQENPTKSKLAPTEYRCSESSTDIPVCDGEGSTGIPACDNQDNNTDFQPVGNEHTNPNTGTESSTGFQPVDVEENTTNPNTAKDGCATVETDTGKDACATFRDRLRLLLGDSDEQPFQDPEVDALIHAIENVRILDPACGSGAFLMGALHRLVHTLRKLDPDNERWKQRQIDAASQAPDPETRERLINEIEENFRNYDDYGRKLYLIENCIYGVDIQPIAVQIAKLRFFISLIVDQNVQPEKDNLGIRALPNLETKFVAANTLVGLKRPRQMLLHNPEIDKLEKELADVRHRHFNAKTPATKRKYREKDRELRQRISELLENDGWEYSSAHQVAAWDPYDQNAAADFFDPEWMFGIPLQTSDSTDVKCGFDLVIGNPPYVRQEAIRDQKPLLKENCPDTYTSTADLYVYFYDRGLQFLHDGGVLCYISSNKYFRAAYGQKLRQHLATNTILRQVIDFGDTPVFTAIAYPTIVITQKVAHKPESSTEESSTGIPACGDEGSTGHESSTGFQSVEKESSTGQESSTDIPVCDKKESSTGVHSVTSQTNQPQPPSESQARMPVLPSANTFRALNWNPEDDITDFARTFRENAFSMRQNDLSADGWRFEHPQVLQLLEKLRNNGTPLGDYVGGRFYYGIKTGCNQAFVIDRATRDRLIEEDPNSADIIKPFLRGRDVKRWRVNFAEQYLIKIESSENKTHPWSHKPEDEAETVFAQTYPAVHRWFQQFREQLINRYDQGAYWWELRACKYWDEFENSKILYPDIYEHQSFAFDKDGYYCANTCYFIPVPEKWLVGLLNSSLVESYYERMSSRIRGGYLRAFTQYLAQLPVPEISSHNKTQLESLVEQILSAKATDPNADVTELEKEINQLVHKLYNLTEEEIAAVQDKR